MFGGSSTQVGRVVDDYQDSASGKCVAGSRIAWQQHLTLLFGSHVSSHVLQGVCQELRDRIINIHNGHVTATISYMKESEIYTDITPASNKLHRVLSIHQICTTTSVPWTTEDS